MKKILLLLLCFILVGCATTAPLSVQPHKVETVKKGPGQWELHVDGKPFFIKGVVFGTSVVGDDPNAQTLRDWSILDLNQNGKNDVAYDSWVDANLNNTQDPDEKPVGDWQLLKDMNANTIRIYQMPSADERIDDIYFYEGARLTFVHPPNKKVYRDLEKRYGIMVIIGHFFGEWGIGSKAFWENGTDYTDPEQRQNILKCVRVMVEEHKDEPYTLMWLLGNENFAPHDNDNAETQIKAFLTLVNEAAEMIHELDPNHPVAICNWDMANIKEMAKWCPAVDIYGTNSYRWGFKKVWQELKENFDRPFFLAEYGFQSKLKYAYDEGAQARYHLNTWKDIEQNRFGNDGVGNSIGGIVFSWNDQWHLGGKPWTHGTEAFVDVEGAEWFGVTSQGDGSDSPFMRQLRKSYFVYQDLWGKNKEK